MNAIITGASSGIGRDLALELARRGWAVAVTARRGDLLATLVAEIVGDGGKAVSIVADAADPDDVRRSVLSATDLLGGPIDLAVANAGVSLPTYADRFVLADAEHMIRLNLLGVLYLFDAVVPSMVARGRGRFAGVASLAGLRGIPGSAVYSATKAAVQAFLEASRVELASRGVGVTTINPGFVATPMTAKNKFRMPLIMQSAEAAAIIADGLERGEREIEFPRPLSLFVRLARLIPNALFDRISAPYARRKIAAPESAANVR